MPTLDALTYLIKTARPPETVGAAFGDEEFLKRRVLAVWKDALCGDDEIGWTTLDGKDLDPATVFDRLSARSLFGGGKTVVHVADADEFVSKNRARLEDYVAAPKSSGVLLLSVRSWPANTRLAKKVAEVGLPVDCNALKPAAVRKWAGSWAKRDHNLVIQGEALDLLLASAGDSLGLIDQEIAKLALVVGDDRTATVELVELYSGGWRVKTAWAMLDDALAGNAKAALLQLDRLLAAGESPIGLLGQIAASLRRFHAATRIVQMQGGRRPNLKGALEAAGVKRFAVEKAEAQLRRLGSVRAGRLTRRLLAADLDLKGAASGAVRSRIALERLLLELAAEKPKQTAAT